jgi:hypothetical protein
MNGSCSLIHTINCIPYKDTWGSIASKFKIIYNYMACVQYNENQWSTMSAQDINSFNFHVNLWKTMY